MEQINQTISQYKRNELIYSILSIIFIGSWTYFYINGYLKIEIVDENFLPSIMIVEISLSCAILLFYVLTKTNLKFKAIYFIILIILYILFLADIIILISAWILNNDLFTSYQISSLLIIGATLLSVTFILLLISTNIKLQVLINELIILYRIQLLRDLLEDAERNIDQNDEQIQRQIRVQSVEQSQLNNVYGQVCAICDEETNQDQKAVQLKCLHIFHSDCIRKWLEKSTVCPNCRNDVNSE